MPKRMVYFRENRFSEFVLLPVLWATSGLDLFFKYIVTQLGWGHLGVFGVIWGQNPNIFKPRQYIYQNEAFGHVITMKWFSRSPDPKFWGHLGSKSKDFRT